MAPQFGGVNSQFDEPKVQVRPRLSMAEREEIMIGTRGANRSGRSLAGSTGAVDDHARNRSQRPGRDAPGRYRACIVFGPTVAARTLIGHRRVWPSGAVSSGTPTQDRKLASCEGLRDLVQARLRKKHSPEQIADEFAKIYPDRPEMQVSHETIIKRFTCKFAAACAASWTTAYVRAGAASTAGRSAHSEPGGRIAGIVDISERPAEAADGRSPGTGRTI